MTDQHTSPDTRPDPSLEAAEGTAFGAGPYRLAIDIGGTFTDLVLQDEAGRPRQYKTSSTPKDLSDGFFTGVQIIADDLGLQASELLARIDGIVHGTTITTNALVTSTGARAGLLTTHGLRDVLIARRNARANQFDSKSAPHPYLVPRYLIRAVRERIDANGEVLVPFHDEDAVEAARYFAENGVEAVAISFAFSFLDPRHEERAAEIIAAELPGVFLSVSSRLAPEVRLYERTSTAALNAYVGPVLQAYLDSLAERLAAHDYRKPVLIMQSNGGVISLSQAAGAAANTLLSGPAGGPAAAAQITGQLGVPKAMTIDMGGTSFEVSLTIDGRTGTTNGGELAGHAISTAILEISTIGAGGGSIAWLTPGGMLRVGPQSAGAEPGPAAYGKGGVDATVTDANLLLGYLDPANFSDGLDLDLAEAEAAVRRIADGLGVSVLDAAAGIYTAINAEMTDSLRLATVRRGFDPREFAIVAAGGAGPVHAVELARDLGVPLVIVPGAASVLCASGMLLTDFTRYYVATLFGAETPDEAELEAAYRELEATADAELAAEGVAGENRRFTRIADMRYVGQVHEIQVEFDAGASVTDDSLARLRGRFHREHLERFGFSQEDAPTEIVNIRVRATGLVDKRPVVAATERRGEPVPHATRPAWFDGGLVDVPVYAALALGAGSTVTGPTLVEQPSSTIVVPAGYSLTTSPNGDYLVHRSDTTVEAVCRQLRETGSVV